MGDSVHQHGDVGPHGGHLIELGRNHKYHAELVEDRSQKTVAIFILDEFMNEASIASDSISIQLQGGGATTSNYELTAVNPDADGRSVKFESRDATLFATFATQELEGRLRAKINGVQYIGRLAHQVHDHALETL